MVGVCVAGFHRMEQPPCSFLLPSVPRRLHTRTYRRRRALVAVVSIAIATGRREGGKRMGGEEDGEKTCRRTGRKERNRRKRERESMGSLICCSLILYPVQGSLYTKVKNQSALFPLYSTRALAPPLFLRLDELYDTNLPTQETYTHTHKFQTLRRL